MFSCRKRYENHALKKANIQLHLERYNQFLKNPQDKKGITKHREYKRFPVTMHKV